MNPSIRRELTVAFRSFRLPGLAVVFLFFALLDPPVIKYMDRLIEMIGGTEGLEITMPPPSPAMALAQFIGDLSGIGVLVLVFLLMGIVASEKATGVTEWVLTRPVTRREYLISKVLVWGTGIVVCTLAAGVVAWAYTWSLLGHVGFLSAGAAFVAVAVYALFISAATFAGSVALNSQLAAGLVGVGAVAAGVLIKPIGTALGLRRYLPYSLPDMANRAIGGAIAPLEIAPAVACSLVVSFLLLVYAFRRFGAMQL